MTLIRGGRNKSNTLAVGPFWWGTCTDDFLPKQTSSRGHSTIILLQISRRIRIRCHIMAPTAIGGIFQGDSKSKPNPPRKGIENMLQHMPIPFSRCCKTIVQVSQGGVAPPCLLAGASKVSPSFGLLDVVKITTSTYRKRPCQICPPRPVITKKDIFVATFIPIPSFFEKHAQKKERKEEKKEKKKGGEKEKASNEVKKRKKKGGR